MWEGGEGTGVSCFHMSFMRKARAEVESRVLGPEWK